MTSGPPSDQNRDAPPFFAILIRCQTFSLSSGLARAVSTFEKWCWSDFEWCSFSSALDATTTAAARKESESCRRRQQQPSPSHDGSTATGLAGE